VTPLLRQLLRNGGSFRVRLLAVILIPLLGMMIAASAQLATRIASVRASSGAEEHIATAAAADAARSAFEQEVVPAFAAAVSRHPDLVKTQLTTEQLGSALTIIGRLPELRSATNAALSDLASRPGMEQQAVAFMRTVQSLRVAIDSTKTLQSALEGPLRLLDALAATENQQIALASRAGLSERAAQALRDVDLVARASQDAAEEILHFSSTKFDISYLSKAVLRAGWLEAWGTYTSSSEAVLARASGAVAGSWQSALNRPEVADLDRFLAADVTDPQPVAMSTLLRQINSDAARNQEFGAVLAAAMGSALAAGKSQHDGANMALWWIILGCLALVAISVGCMSLVQRSVTKPLRDLARQAEQISRGELGDVHTAGPYEVRTVATALASSVASLRNVQAQAAAVAAGDLDSPVVQTALPGPLGEVVHSSVTRIISAINERELARHELAHQASHDALTELPNRAQAMSLIEQALHRAQRAGTKTALMFVDLDRFKAVNDNLGHAAGDEVLRTAARRMRSAVREGDIVARLGGDEFVILLEAVDDEADSVNLAERIVMLTAEPMRISERDVRVGASIGLAFCRDGYVDADRLLHEADAAAYRAKDAGRDRVEVFDDDLRTQLKQRSDLEASIRSALAQKEFTLHYQPLVGLMTGATDGMEALIRWNRPDHGLVTPDDFIPVAEQSPLINEIGRWVLMEACRQLVRWQSEGTASDELTMSVNISGRHIASSDFIADVTAALAETGVRPDRLIVEITETVLVDDPIATRNMQAIRELGVQIAIDDFGTGFTSIGQLPKLPVDSLKIDRSFVASTDPAHRELVRLIVAAAHAFGLTVVAEGIELDEQADGLRELQVESGQGFLFARPQAAETLFQLSPTGVA
jgi:diguanylate cyclase (GGDEF)-like protein